MNAQSRSSLLASGAAATPAFTVIPGSSSLRRREAQLPFIRGANFWNPERSGDYNCDLETGRRYGRDLVNYIRRLEAPPTMLKHICGAMPPDRDEWGAVELGFFSALGSALAE
jgi:hypothetical protein